MDVARLWLGARFLNEIEAGRGFLWLPVGMAVGIGIYFSLPREPMLFALAGLALAAVLVARRLRERPFGFPIAALIAAMAAGLVIAKARTELVAAPRLDREMTATVIGWVEEAEEASGGLRLLIRVSSISDVSSPDQPDRVRMSVRHTGDIRLRAGDGVSVRGRLRPPRGPPIPGGYDFARAQYFAGIGATGFAYGAPKPAGPGLGPPPWDLKARAILNGARGAVAARIRDVLSGDTGAVASALIVGQRRGISEETTEALRTAGLAHILAISGLHMALVAGTVFGVVRGLLALFPGIALRHPVRQWAALTALGAGAVYLGLSGAGIATQRAFVMAAIVFAAILAGRPALTMRSVAVAALIVMVLAPEVVVGPSFQMSFAAVVALIAAYETLSERRNATAFERRGIAGLALKTLGFYVGGLALTSLIAGLATAPYAVFHFQRLAPLGLVANLAAMPLVAFVVMPLGVLSLIAIPFGLDPLVLPAMGWGIDRVIGIADWVAAATGTGSIVGRVPGVAVLSATAGLLWLALWKTRLRLFGLAGIGLGMALAPLAATPHLLISDDGRLVALRGPGGTLRFAPDTRNDFVVGTWLRADGDPRPVDDPSLVAGVLCDDLGCVLEGAERQVGISGRGPPTKEAAERSGAPASNWGQEATERQYPNGTGPPEGSLAANDTGERATANGSDLAPQHPETTAPARPPPSAVTDLAAIVAKDRARQFWRIALVRRSLAFAEDCHAADIIIASFAAPKDCARHALVFDRAALARTGATAITFTGDGDAPISIETALSKLRRPWHPPAPPERR
ncbi:ComEC/Rec2 family competence protein [Rhodobium gokarnense]|uniref:Competence protein ComEC n=1 Tax=Rhodobium gokarnense TaxID=364296 RepID=A0ABT3HFG7_9HYPH|nr:ComEC/Rec2 family competence protein [Rhodobium gokarnense]MCW2309132.1 competence protein ComEC [Rhodobium gokarnense]